MMITFERLQEVLARLPGLTIGLLGDLFLDRYLEIEPGLEERSIETGLEAYQVARVRNSPGALGTVMNNLAALGVGKLVPVTVIGDDGHGYDLLKELRKLAIDLSHVVQRSDRLTPTYTKPLRPGARGQWVELNRLDVRTRGPLSEETTELLCGHLRQVLRATDGLMVLDQLGEANWGVVSRPVRRLLAELVQQHPEKLVLIDSRDRIGAFSCGLLKGNRSEMVSAAGLSDEQPSAAETAVTQLSSRTGRVVFCTLGEQGILIGRPGGEPVRVPGYPVRGPIDIVGAGDSATAGILASLLAGASEIEAAAVGNLVASITVQQLGTTGTASPEQLRQRWQETHPATFRATDPRRADPP